MADLPVLTIRLNLKEIAIIGHEAQIFFYQETISLFAVQFLSVPGTSCPMAGEWQGNG